MANKLYQDILKNDILELVSKSEAINSINHNGIKGNIRENGLSSFIRKYLPQQWECGAGKIHDFNGVESSETDLIIYDKNSLPKLFEETTGVYPIESCKYAIEVKTKSTAQEIKSTINKFRKLFKLNSLHNQLIPTTLYFAYSSNFKKAKQEFYRYKKYDPHFNTNPAIRVFCVLGQGYWYFNNNRIHLKSKEKVSIWRFLSPKQGNFELACLLGGIINTLNKDKPEFGHYIMGNEDNFEELEVYSLEKDILLK
jgi:hypothetical protein